MSFPRVKLMDIAAQTKYPIGDGDHGAIKPVMYKSEGIPYIRVGDMDWNGNILFEKMVYISEEVNSANKKSHLFPNDILISKTGATIGKVAIIPDTIPNSNTTASIGKISIDSKKAFGRYVFWCMKSRDFQSQMWRVSHKSAQPGFNVKDLKVFEIPLPPLKTQQDIASILDDAADLRDKTNRLITEYNLLTQSIFLDMFGDPFNNQKNFEKGTVRDLVSEAKYGTSTKASEEGEFCYLRMNNITYSGYMNYEKLKYVDIPKKDLTKYIVRKGDLLFNRTNSKELVGKTAVFDSDKKMIAAGYLIRVRLNEKGNPYFVWGYLNSKHGKLILNRMCKSIVGMANINAQELQNIKILLPPIELQNQFAEKIALIEQQKTLARKELKESEDLFNCLLQKAFKGELV